MGSLRDFLQTLERQDTPAVIPDHTSFIVRIDGRAFSKFTKNLEKPFDQGFESVMNSVAQDLAAEFNAMLVYHQSDEISLLFRPSPNPRATPLFSGRSEKILSLIAGFATGSFCGHLFDHYPRERAIALIGLNPHFDSRILILPQDFPVIHYFATRVRDYDRNSISMICHNLFSHKSVQGLNTDKRIEKINANSNILKTLPNSLRWGTFYIRTYNAETLRRIFVPYNPPDAHTETLIKNVMTVLEDSERKKAEQYTEH